MNDINMKVIINMAMTVISLDKLRDFYDYVVQILLRTYRMMKILCINIIYMYIFALP